MQLPFEFLKSLEGITGFDLEAFNKTHAVPEQVTSIRINPFKFSREELMLHEYLSVENNVPWTQLGYYLSRRPSFTFDPIFHAGCYYVQDASSMFLELAFTQLTDLSKPLKVLDLSAAPGGKTTHILSLISSQSLLVSNEVIKSRAQVLTDNVIKWGAANVIVTNNDPSAFQRLPSFFDVMVIDAPCSGSGLFRREEEAISEWSLNAVQLCSQRQQRILADALPALKENGLLVYSTCSYSREEDEDIADWLVRDQQMESMELKTEDHWHIIKSVSPEAGASGYRFFPDKLKGEGFYMACFRKKGAAHEKKFKENRLERTSAKERILVETWLEKGDYEILKHQEEHFAIPGNLIKDLSILQASVYIQYAGLRIGQIIREKLLPHHALAMSPLLLKSVPDQELDYENAILYLQRKEMHLEAPSTGWQTVSYKNRRLGWINALKNRINNYYPKELRILKQQNDSGFEKI